MPKKQEKTAARRRNDDAAARRATLHLDDGNADDDVGGGGGGGGGGDNDDNSDNNDDEAKYGAADARARDARRADRHAMVFETVHALAGQANLARLADLEHAYLRVWDTKADFAVVKEMVDQAMRYRKAQRATRHSMAGVANGKSYWSRSWNWEDFKAERRRGVQQDVRYGYA